MVGTTTKLVVLGGMMLLASASSSFAQAEATSAESVVGKAINGTKLLEVAPTDIGAFCPHFDTLAESGKLAFWTALLENVAQAESHGNAAKTTWRPYDGAVHRPAFRRGPLQISIEAAHSSKYQCDAADSAALRDPDINLACGAHILAASVVADSAISRSLDGHVAGGGRYWPSLKRDKSRAAIASRTAAIAPCSSASIGAPR